MKNGEWIIIDNLNSDNTVTELGLLDDNMHFNDTEIIANKRNITIENKVKNNENEKNKKGIGQDSDSSTLQIYYDILLGYNNNNYDAKDGKKFDKIITITKKMATFLMNG
uniref:Uncharacterized protein n=1 Tax=Parastrongyloides trichosuri TaxID=131310 RepID=A0A0N5A7I4_PARTI